MYIGIADLCGLFSLLKMEDMQQEENRLQIVETLNSLRF